MRYLISPYNLGYGSGFEHLPSVRGVESDMRMDLSGRERQKERDPPGATGELPPCNHRGCVNFRVVFDGATFYQHIFDN